MALYEYLPTVPIDVEGNLWRGGGSGALYLATDTQGTTPLTPRDANGTPFPGGLVTITALGMIPGFFIDDYPVVMWRSGTAPPVPLEAAGARIPRGGTAGQVIRKSSAVDYAVEWGDAPSGGGGGGGGSGGGNGDYWNKQQTAPVVTIGPTAPWPTDAPPGALIVRLTGSGA